MDVVIQFATHKLGFQLSDIIIYAWSIGGFTGKPRRSPTLDRTWSAAPQWLPFVFKVFPRFSKLVFPVFSATWAVMSYPEIRSVVLDASFDDLLPLALKVMPDSWSESTRGLCPRDPA